MERHMYIDESGDLGTKSDYLIITALVVNDPKPLNRIIKNMRRHKFKRQLKKATEIKANKSNQEIIEHMLEKLNDIENIEVYHVVLKKKEVTSPFLIKDKHKQYNYVAGKLAQQIYIDGSLVIHVDKSKGKQILRADFDKYFEERLRNGARINKIKIYHSYSHAWAGLQFADIIAWSVFQKFQHGNEHYLGLLNIPQEMSYVWNKK